MRNDTILVLGGLALVLFFASSGSGTVKDIEERVLNLDELFETWAEKHKDNPMTRLMEDFLHSSAKVRGIDSETVKTMTKRDLLEFVSMTGEPVNILVKLSKTCRTSFVKDKSLVEQFVDTAKQILWLILKLFEDVYKLLRGENQTSAELVTEGLHERLHEVITFSI